jgi:hypothetical protein
VPNVTGPGAGDPFDPWDLSDVRDRVVHPVVSALIQPVDLGHVDVGWGPREHVPGLGLPPLTPRMDPLVMRRFELAGGEEELEELWLLVRTTDATWHAPLWQPMMTGVLATVGEVVHHLADRLEDWVCEDVYWAEQAVANVSIPERAGG